MRRARLAVGLVVAVTMLAGAGCASVPSSGPVMYRAAEDDAEESIALNPPAPRDGAGPEELIKSFLNAGSSGATAPTRYETAELYLTEEARKDWLPTANVVIYSGVPEYTVTPQGEDRAQVSLSVQAEAGVDAHGTYTEESGTATYNTTFTLERNAEDQWRVSNLQDGVFVLATQFADQFRATPVYFPSQDDQFWVPDQRWFPRSAWRTSAVAEMLSGPPEWLRSAVGTAAPPGTQLAVRSVTENADGEMEVRLGEEIADLPESEQSLLQAQLAVTLSDSGVRPEIALYAADGRLPDTAAKRPALPETRGLPIALSDGRLYTVSDRELTDFEDAADFEGLSPTAIARGPEAGPVVVRDAMRRIVQVTGPGTAVGQLELMTGKDLVAPSVDTYGYVWTSDDPGHDVGDDALGRLLVTRAGGQTATLRPDWLRGRQVIGLRIAPDGTRIVIVSRTSQSTSVHVAAVVRNEKHEPIQITTGVEVGATVSGVTTAQWSGETSLLLFTRDDDVTAMHVTGVGGLSDAGGSTEPVQELPGVRTVTAGVTDSGALALTNDGDLYEEQTTGWGDPIAQDIDAVAYPG